MRVDAAGRIWVTDGLALYGGNGESFTEAGIVAAEHIRMLQVILGGRLGVLTVATAYTLPLVPTTQMPNRSLDTSARAG